MLRSHYHPSGKVEQDRGKIALYFAKEKGNKNVVSFAMGTRGINIPPGERRYERAVTAILPVDVTVIGVAPHMHYLGREMKAWATTPDGKTVPLIWIKDWDFNWQGQYFYKQPLRLPKASSALQLLQRVRDESHRFALRAHRRRRGGRVSASVLDEVPGIGPARRKLLVQRFGSVEQIRKAGLDEIALVPGIGRELALSLWTHLGGAQDQ